VHRDFLITLCNDDDDNNNNNNLIKFNGYFLTCKFQNKSAYYKASTKTQAHQQYKYTKKQNTKQAKQKQCGRKNSIQEVLGQNSKP